MKVYRVKVTTFGHPETRALHQHFAVLSASQAAALKAVAKHQDVTDEHVEIVGTMSDDAIKNAGLEVDRPRPL